MENYKQHIYCLMSLTSGR